MPTTTKLSNLIDPQLMADAISAELPNSIKFAPLARIDTSLKENAGSSITIPRFEYIGDAEDVEEGEAIPIELLNATSTSETVKKAGKGLKITDESLLSGYGDPEGEAKNQLKLSISNKLDNDCLETLETIKAPMTVDKSTDVISASSISDALVKFGEAIDDPMVLVIAPEQLATLRTSPEFTKASDLGDSVLMTGVIGAIYGCQIIVSGKIKVKADKFDNYIIKPGALAIYMKKEVDIETARDIEHKLTVITADQHYVVGLENEAKAIKLKTKATPKA